MIAPSGGIPETPEDSQLIQIGFDYSLNYPFIVAHPLSVAQIFQYLPAGVSYGLAIDSTNVSMRSIEPYQSQSAGYVISVALAYIPKSLISTLDAMIHTPTSQLYRNPNTSVNTLMNLIDPSIPLIPGTADSSPNPKANSAAPSPSATSAPRPSSSNDAGGIQGNKAGVQNSGSLDQPVQSNSTVSSRTVGIAVGTVTGAIAYAGLMVIAARSYRKKKNVSLDGRDSPYLATGGPESDAGSANSQASVRSGPIPREQISEPVMSENSLGWT